MDLIKIASKIDDFEKDLTFIKNKLEIAEEKITLGLSANFEVKSVENSSQNDSEDFINFLRTGEVKSEGIMEFKSRKGVFEGGIPVSSNSSNLISLHLSKISVLRKLCKFQAISSDSFDVIIEENGGKATWGTPDDKEPFVKKFIKTFELVAEPKATSKLIEDVRIDVEKFMSEKIAESFAIAEDDAFLNGNGVECPTGILTLKSGSNANSIERIEGAITTEVICDVIDALDPFYANNCVFLMNKEVEMKVKALKDVNGRNIWQPKIMQGEFNTIFGLPIYISNFMPSNQILFGNFEKGYTIVEKVGNYMMRDPYTQRPFIKFYTSKKIGGDVVDGNAFKILKIK
jgi:HK97 family phage major capsid protein